MNKEIKYFIKANSEREIFEVRERNGINDDGIKEDAIIADVYRQEDAEFIVDCFNKYIINLK